MTKVISNLTKGHFIPKIKIKGGLYRPLNYSGWESPITVIIDIFNKTVIGLAWMVPLDEYGLCGCSGAQNSEVQDDIMTWVA